MSPRDDPQNQRQLAETGSRSGDGPPPPPPPVDHHHNQYAAGVDQVATAEEVDAEEDIEEVNNEEEGGGDFGTATNRQNGSASQEEDAEAGGDNNNDNDIDLPPYLQGPLDPARMKLSDEEREWALEVKDTLESLPDLDPISDFMVAQIALVEWESRCLEKAIDHAYSMQQYREAFGIVDTFAEGRRGVEFNIRRHPGYILHFCRMEGSYAIVFDMTKFDSTVLSDVSSRERMHKAAYYFNHAFTPDLAAAREGVIWIMECEGLLWKAPRMVTFDVFRVGFEDVIANYPFRLNQLRFCNTGVIVNTMVSMIRRYIPDRLHKKFQVGHTTEQRLDSICLVPNLEEATDRIVKAMTESLRRRYEAERIFSLE